MKESLYKRIARELAHQISTGTYPPGSLFPTEMELCETWQVSRHTMREALRELTEQGLISRRKGAGTRVCEPQASGVNHPLSHLEDLLLLAKNNLRVIKKIDEIVARPVHAGYISPVFVRMRKTRMRLFAGRTVTPAPIIPGYARSSATIRTR